MTTGLFTTLSQYTKAATITMIVTENAQGDMTVIVMPAPKDSNAPDAMKQPIKLTGKPAELDAGLIAALSEIGSGYTDLAATVAAVKAIQDKAKTEVAAKAAEKAAEKASAKPATKVINNASTNNQNVAVTTAAPLEQTEPETADASDGDTTGNLFDL